jgi:hypothetical protein
MQFWRKIGSEAIRFSEKPLLGSGEIGELTTRSIALGGRLNSWNPESVRAHRLTRRVQSSLARSDAIQDFPQKRDVLFSGGNRFFQSFA